MAGPTCLRVRVLPRKVDVSPPNEHTLPPSENDRTHSETLKTTTAPPSLPHPEGKTLEGTYEEEDGNLYQSHVFFIEDMKITMRPRPKVHLDRPSGWKWEDWDDRVIFGDDKYHIFTTNLVLGPWFVLKVSDAVDRNGRWFYVDMEEDFNLEPERRNALGDANGSTMEFTNPFAEEGVGG